MNTMRQGITEARVSVLVELADGSCFYKNWVGKTINGIRKAARKRYQAEYQGARVSFGNGVYTTSYGAH